MFHGEHNRRPSNCWGLCRGSGVVALYMRTIQPTRARLCTRRAGAPQRTDPTRRCAGAWMGVDVTTHATIWARPQTKQCELDLIELKPEFASPSPSPTGGSIAVSSARDERARVLHEGSTTAVRYVRRTTNARDLPSWS